MNLLEGLAAATPGVKNGQDRVPKVWLRDFGESGTRMELRVYVPSSRERNPVRTALMLAIKERFDEQGIEIPMPQREIRLRQAQDDDEG